MTGIPPTREELLAAIQEVADGIMQSSNDCGPYDHLSCSELRPYVALLRLAGQEEAAQMMTECHIPGDDDQGDEHHDLYLQLMAGEL